MPTRSCWLVVLAMAAACGGSEKPPPKAEPEPEPEPEVTLRGAITETPGLNRTAEVTTLTVDQLVKEGFLYIGTIACEPGPKAQDAILKAAGLHGGDLVLPLAPESIDILGATDETCGGPAAKADAGGGEESGGEGDATAGGGEETSAGEGEAAEGGGEEASAGEGDAAGAGEGEEASAGEGEAADGGEGEEASAGAAAAPGACGDSKPFPMLGMVWAQAGDAPPEVVELWQKQDGIRKLHVAVASQDLEAISELVSAGADINSPDELGRYALYRAALSGDDEYVAMIVGLGATADPPPMWGRSLLENVVDIELRRYQPGNFSTFPYAAHKRTLEVIVGTGTNASPALVRAVQRGFCETAEHLSTLGAEGELCDRDGKAAEQKHQKDALGQSYRVALDEGRLDDVKQLLKDGIDIGFTLAGTPWEATPMEKAIEDGKADVVEFLLKKKVTHKFSDSPATQGLLCAAARAGNKFIVQQLLKADISLAGALHCAAVSSDAKKMVPLLLGARVDVDGLNADGLTALYFLVKESLAELKKKNGIEGDEPPAEPPAEYGKELGDLDKTLNKSAGMLLKKGANPNLAPEGAPTVVEMAESHGLKKTGAALAKAAKKKR